MSATPPISSRPKRPVDDASAAAPVSAPAPAPVEASPAPLQCDILRALSEVKAAGRLQPTREISAKNLAAVMEAMIAVQKPPSELPRNYWIGDIEGLEKNPLETLREAGVIASKPDGSDAKFRDERSRIVFLGDIGDRGPATIRARRTLLELKKRHPDRVDLLWGNRCIAKLGLLNDLPRLKSLEYPGYEAWLAQDPTRTNSLGHQVQFWLKEHAAHQELDFHQQELEILEHYRSSLALDQQVDPKSISLDQAAQAYVESLRPGGEFFEFLKRGNFAATADRLEGPIQAFHGGPSDHSIRQVPMSDRELKGARDWAWGFQSLGRRLILECEANLRAGNSEPVPRALLALGDSDYDPKAGFNSFKAWSPIYGMRDMEDGNYRGVSPRVEAFYLGDGLRYDMVGHTPIGALPTPLKSRDAGGVTRVYHDTSMIKDGSISMVCSVGDLVVMAGRVGSEKDGELVLWSLRPDQESPVGKVTKDGYTVRGVTLDGNYSLARYVNGHEIDTKKVSPRELVALEPKASPLETSEQQSKGRDDWYRAVRAEGHDLIDAHGLERALTGRTPLVVSGSSEFGDIPATPEEIRRHWASLDRPELAGLAALTGGTNVESTKTGEKAPEYTFHEAAAYQGLKVIGLVPEITNTSILAKNDHLFIAGKREEWDAPLGTALSVAEERRGAALFIGGGGVIRRAIERAVKRPELQVLLMVGADVEERAKTLAAGGQAETKGASDRVAVELLAKGALPSHFTLVRSSDDLGALLAGRLAPSARVGDPAVERRAKRVGVFLGSFDPPHRGHVKTLETMKKRHRLDAVYVVPDAVSEYKDMAPLAVRERMTRTAFEGIQGVRFLDAAQREQAGDGQMWSVLRAIRASHPNAEVFNIAGNDTLEWWSKLPEETRRSAGPVQFVVNLRDGAPVPSELDGQPIHAHVVSAGDSPSSTRNRRAIAEGRRPPDLSAPVLRIIRTHGLYGAHPPRGSAPPSADALSSTKAGATAETLGGVAGVLSERTVRARLDG